MKPCLPFASILTPKSPRLAAASTTLRMSPTIAQTLLHAVQCKHQAVRIAGLDDDIRRQVTVRNAPHRVRRVDRFAAKAGASDQLQRKNVQGDRQGNDQDNATGHRVVANGSSDLGNLVDIGATGDRAPTATRR